MIREIVKTQVGNGLVNTRNSVQKGSADFSKILQEKVVQQDSGDVKFSSHALKRLHSRGMEIDNRRLDKLNTAVQKLNNKGSKESLVIMDEMALIVSVKNRTVITAMNGSKMKENIFTNIDSTMII